MPALQCSLELHTAFPPLDTKFWPKRELEPSCKTGLQFHWTQCHFRLSAPQPQCYSWLQYVSCTSCLKQVTCILWSLGTMIFSYLSKKCMSNKDAIYLWFKITFGTFDKEFLHTFPILELGKVTPSRWSSKQLLMPGNASADHAAFVCHLCLGSHCVLLCPPHRRGQMGLVQVL